MGESMEHTTLLNMRSYLRIGFKKNLVDLASEFHRVGLIDDECYETVTPAASFLSPLQKAEEIAKSVIDSVELSEAKYGEMMDILAANSSIYGPLVEKLDDEYKRQGGTITYAKKREVVKPKAFHTELPVWSTEVRSMGSLNLVRYYDPKTGKKKNLRILEDIAADWEEIGEMLGFRPPEIITIRGAGAGKTPKQCLRDILTRWIANSNGMPNSDRFPGTWLGIHNLLVDSLHGATAKDLKDAIDTTYSDLHNNFDKAPEDKSARVVASVEVPPTRPQETSRPSAPEPQKATQDKPAATAGATGGDEARLLSDYQHFVNTKDSLDLIFMKFLFLGPPNLGKSTTCRRLMGEIVDLKSAGEADQAQPSTGVLESGQMVVKRVSATTALIAESEWCKVKSLQDEACVFFRNLVGAIKKKPSTESGHSTNSPTKTEEESAAVQHTVASPSLAFRILQLLVLVLSFFNPFKQGCQKTSQQDTPDKPDSIQQDMPEVLAMFKNAMESSYWGDLKHKFKAYVRVEDTGGQPELMDMLPALTLGPGIYLLFINLQHDLDHHYKLIYRDKRGESTTPVESTYTVKETLLSSLSSITCSNAISSRRRKDEEKATTSSKSNENSSNSVAYIVGTHKDKVSEEDIKEINKELRKVIESTYFFNEDIVLTYLPDEIIIPVNNHDGGPEEVKNIKRILDDCMEKNFKTQPIPAIWLFFSLLLRNNDMRTASLAFCKQLSVLLNMTHDETKAALWFLHHHVGILMYFPNVPELKDLVIIDVQVVYDSVTTLILKAMCWDTNKSQSKAEHFKRTGQFLLSRINNVTSKVLHDLIPPPKLVALLEYLHIVAKILTPQQPSSLTSSSNEACNEEVVYIMPCVLNNATREELDSISKRPHKGSPIMVRFKCGFVPIGVFPALVACLISNKSSFTLVQEGILKNVVQFRYGTRQTLLTLICRSTYFEVIISEFVLVNTELHMECAAIRCEIESSFNTISRHVNYGSLTEYQFAFECPLPHTEKNSREHLCVVKETVPMPELMHCLNNRDPMPIQLPDKHKVWFDQHLPSAQIPNSNQDNTSNSSGASHFQEINTPDASVNLPDSPMSSTDRDSRIFPISICSCVALFGGILGLLSLLLAIAIAVFLRFGGSIHHVVYPDCTAMDNCSPSLHQMQYFQLNDAFIPIYIIEEVARDCKTLGIDLKLPSRLIWNVWDDHGTIEGKCSTTFNLWLQGKGEEPATWQTFLQGLRKRQLHDIADRIQKQIETLFSAN